MYRISKAILLAVAAFVLLPFSLAAQSAARAASSLTTSHEITLRVTGTTIIGLNNTDPIELAVNVPSAGGMNVSGSTDSSKYLQYTSIVERGMVRRITVNMNTGDQTPSGTGLYLEAIGVPTGCGTAAGQIKLSDTPQNLITDIGSGRTGAQGVILKYDFEIDAFESLLVGESQTVAVVFTMAEAS